MSRKQLIPIAFGAVLFYGLLSPLNANEPSNERDVESLTPFTHTAYLPEGSDISTIRFEKVRMVRVPTTVSYTIDIRYCAQAAFRDPGGSEFCNSAQDGSAVLAYEVTYSFDGPSMEWDDLNSQRHSAFQVYFRPDDLTPEMRAAFARHKISRADEAAYFAVNTGHDSEQTVVVDEAQSSFCATTLIDGDWAQNDTRCVARTAYKTVTRPSTYISVRIELVPSRGQSAAAA